MSTPWLTTFPTPTRATVLPSQEDEARTRIAGAPAVLIPSRRATDFGHRTRTARQPGWFLGEWAGDADGAA